MVRDAFAFGVTEGHADTRIGDAAGAVYFGGISLTHLESAGEAHFLDVAAFVARGGETVVDPQEGTDLHPLFGTAELLDAIGMQADNLARTEVAVNLVVEVGETARLAGGGIGSVLATDDDGGASPLVARSDDAVFGQEQHGAGTLDVLIDILDAFDKVLALDDEQGDEFGLVGLAGAELGEVHVLPEQLLFELGDVDNLGHGDDGKTAEVGIENDGLRIGVADDADAGVALELVQLVFKLRTEISTFQIVDGAVETVSLPVVSGHTATFRS